MTYRPVVDRFAVSIPLDPPSAALFVAVFIGAAWVTSRRPVYGLCALVLATPVAFAHEILGTTITIEKAVLLGVLLGLTTYRGNTALLRRRPALPLLTVLCAFVVVTALTAIDAVYRGVVVREALKAAQYAATFLAAFLCYARDREDGALIGTISITAIAVAISALAQELLGSPSGLYIGGAIVPRIAGLLEGPNQLAAYCEIAVATLGAWALVRRSRLLDVALVLTVCAGVLTFSRAGWIALAAVGVILIAVGGRAAWPALRPAAGGLVIGIAGALWWAVYAHTPGVLRASLEPSLYAGGVGNRSELWHAAWRMWRAHPILGVGAGNFELLLASYGISGVRTHANSWYLQSLAEGGFLLFAVTIALLVTILTSFGRRMGSASPWVLAALAATVALALHQVVDYLVFYPKVGSAWWLLIGIAAAAACSA
ncbi:MAG TPA: O-antigen ligase family protein [Candidatus Cybelea sp.]